MILDKIGKETSSAKIWNKNFDLNKNLFLASAMSILLMAGNQNSYAEDIDITEDQDDIELGSVIIDTNNNKWNLELDEISLNVSSIWLLPNQVIENVVAIIDWQSYDLENSSFTKSNPTIYSDSDLNIKLNSGVTDIKFIADVAPINNFWKQWVVNPYIKLNSESTKFTINDDKGREVDSNIDIKQDLNTLNLKKLWSVVKNITAELVSNNKILFKFDIIGLNFSSLNFNEMDFNIFSDKEKIDYDSISEVVLYENSISENNVLKKLKWNKLWKWIHKFYGFNSLIDLSKFKSYVISIKFKDSVHNNGNKLNLTALIIGEDDKKDLLEEEVTYTLDL